MKRTRAAYTDEINAIVEKYGVEHLVEWQTRPASLRFVFGDSVWIIKASTKLARRELAFELGKLDTLARCVTARWPEQPKAKKAKAARRLSRQIDIESYPGVSAHA